LAQLQALQVFVALTHAAAMPAAPKRGPIHFHLTAGGGGRFRQFVSEQDSGGDGNVEHCGQNWTSQAQPQ